jgi:hypothetical protein
VTLISLALIGVPVGSSSSGVINVWLIRNPFSFSSSA